jgi:nucleotide-binding universal stress UspA family protein
MLLEHKKRFLLVILTKIPYFYKKIREMETKLVNTKSTNYSAALLIRSRLEFEGIETYLANVNLIQSDIATGVKILVKDSDAKRALQIIREAEKKRPGKEVAKSQPITLIICPVDFSKDSLNASFYALQLAAKIKAEVRFLHACYSIQPMAHVFPDAFSYQISMGNIFNDQKLNVKDGMKKFLVLIKQYIKDEKLPDIKITSTIIFEDPLTAIPRYCKKFKSAMLVMGTKGIGRSRNLLAGSITLRTIEKVSQPVLVVPLAYRASPIRHLNNMYITDFDDRDFSSFRKLMSIISMFEVDIKCIHIQKEKEKISEIMLEELTEHIKNVYSDYNVSCQLIGSKDISKSINRFVTTNKINLISLSEQKRNFLFQLFSKSIIKEILFKVDVPMLVFKY